MRLRAAAVLAAVTLAVAVARAEDVDPEWVGTWKNTGPDPNDPKITWTATFTVKADGTARLELTNGTVTLPPGDMRFEAKGGNFKATPTAGEPNTGVYKLVDGKMHTTDKNGVKVAWTRVAAPKKEAPAPAPKAPTGKVDPAFAGVWRFASPDGQVVATLDVSLEGTYVLTIDGGESPKSEQGRIEASEGKWRLVSTARREDEGTYEVQGAAVVLTGRAGPATWQRVSGPVPLVDTRPAEERLVAASPAAANVALPAGLPDFLDGLNALGALDGQRALAAFEKAVQADDSSALYHRARGLTYLVYEKPSEAASDFQRANRLHADKLDAKYLWTIDQVAGKQGGDVSPGTPQNDYERLLYDAGGAYGDATRTRRTLEDKAYMKAFPQQGPKLQREIEDHVKRGRGLLGQLARAFAEHAKGDGGAPVARALYARAKGRFEKGDAQGALDDLRTTLAAFPEDALALLLHARCALACGYDEPARAELTRILTIATDHGGAYALRAIANARLGSGARARADLELAAKLAPKDAEAAKPLVDKALAVSPGDVAAAVAELDKGARSDSTHESLVAKAATVVRATNEKRRRLDETYQEQLRVLEAAVRAEPRNPDRFAALGLFLYNASQEPRWERVEPRGPGRSYRYTTRSSEAQERARAERCADLALSVNPDHVRALAVKARCRLYLLQWADAEDLIRHGLKVEPRNPDLMEALVEVVEVAANQRLWKASALRTPASWDEPGYGGTWHYTRYPSPAELAEADRLEKDAGRLFDYASAKIDELLTKGAETAEDHVAHAAAHRYRGDREAAKKSCLEAIALKPLWQAPRMQLAILLDADKQPGLAFAERVTAINLLETTAAPLLRLGAAEIARTDWKAARAALDKAREVDPADPRAWAYAGAALQAQHDGGAAAFYRAALAVAEVRSRAGGVSLAPDARTWLEPEDVGFTLELRLRLAAVSATPEERAAAVAPIVSTIEPRLSAPHPEERVNSAQLPDGATDPDAIPEAPRLSELLAWAHVALGRNLLQMGREDDAIRALLPLRPYVHGKDQPASRLGSLGTTEVHRTIAGLILARLAFKRGDPTAAHELYMAAAGHKPTPLRPPVAEAERQAYFEVDKGWKPRGR